jgi:hypothetical protein
VLPGQPEFFRACIRRLPLSKEPVTILNASLWHAHLSAIPRVFDFADYMK